MVGPAARCELADVPSGVTVADQAEPETKKRNLLNTEGAVGRHNDHGCGVLGLKRLSIPIERGRAVFGIEE